MRLNDIYKIADAFAPKTLSNEYCEKYGAYDNSGILLDAGEEITGILFSLDFSLAAIEKAIKQGVNLIVTHHPAIYGGISSIEENAFSPLGKKLNACIKNGISVISMHLNLDGAQGGTDESLMQGVYDSANRVRVQTDGAGTRSTANVVLRDTLTQGGYGRVYDVPKTTLQTLQKEIEKEFSTKRIQVYGNADYDITRIASFCGGGADESAVEFAVKHGAQLLISADFKHHVLTLAMEKGLSVLTLTHYASENYGFKKYYEKIRQEIEIPCIYHTDEYLL